MSTQVGIFIKATDEASRIVADASTKIQGDLNRVDEAGKRVQESTQRVTASSKDLVMGFSGVATSAFALYNAYDAVQDMQVSVDRANVSAKGSLNSLEDAQRKYNETVRLYGEDSEKAQIASKDLTLAQERYQVAAERAEMMQGNLNERMVSSALMVIPSVITMIGSLKAI